MMDGESAPYIPMMGGESAPYIPMMGGESAPYILAPYDGRELNRLRIYVYSDDGREIGSDSLMNGKSAPRKYR